MSRTIHLLPILSCLIIPACQRDRDGDAGTASRGRTTETTILVHDEQLGGAAISDRETSSEGDGIRTISTKTATPHGERPVPGLPEGWQLAPGGATYSARQASDQVTIKAAGESPSAGYEVKLFTSPLRIYPPQFILGRRPPSGASAQVITPFEATASFKAKDPVRALTVTDAAGRQDVQVTSDK